MIFTFNDNKGAPSRYHKLALNLSNINLFKVTSEPTCTHWINIYEPLTFGYEPLQFEITIKQI